MANCQCGATATHKYGRLRVCEDCYKDLAKSDDSPNSVPRGYKWRTEMDRRRIE